MSFRKKSAEEVAESVEADIDHVPSSSEDEGWLSGVERRATEFAEPDPSEDVESHDPPEDSFAAADATLDPTAEVAPSVEPFAAAVPMVPTAPDVTYPDVGMVYSGLESEGVVSFPAEETELEAPELAESTSLLRQALEATALPTTAERSIEHGPVGAEATPFLEVLGLADGCSWGDVTTVRRNLLQGIPATGSPEELQMRAEVNHACASLRLLRVGSLTS